MTQLHFCADSDSTLAPSKHVIRAFLREKAFIDYGKFHCLAFLRKDTVIGNLGGAATVGSCRCVSTLLLEVPRLLDGPESKPIAIYVLGRN
jgi:hypothetical protein